MYIYIYVRVIYVYIYICMYVCITESLCCTAQINSTLEVSCISIKKKKKAQVIRGLEIASRGTDFQGVRSRWR